MQRRKMCDRVRRLTVLLFLSLFCYTASAQKSWVVSVDYEQELAFYRPRVAIAEDGRIAVAWETYKKLVDSEEWQIGVQQFNPSGQPKDEVAFIRDPETCESEVEGHQRGVQNADLQFGDDSQLYLAMEPVISQYESSTTGSPRTILATIGSSGTVVTSSSLHSCKEKLQKASHIVKSDRPQINMVPGAGTMLAVGSIIGQVTEWPVLPPQELSLISVSTRGSASADVENNDSYYDSWHDVVTNGHLTALSWHRCPIVNELGDADECDIMVEFSAKKNEEAPILKPRTHKVNNGDRTGVLNYRPAIAMNAIGQSVVVWVDYRYEESGEIYAQRFDESGQPVEENIRISEGTGIIEDLDGIGPEVALLDDGRFLVVWTERTEATMQARGRYFAADGHADGGSFLLDQEQGVESGFAHVASNGSQFAYSWLTKNDGSSAIFYEVPGRKGAIYRSRPEYDADFLFTGYPNPFTEETTVQYVLREAGHVTLVMYDLLGREVKKLIDTWQTPGTYLVDVPADELAMGYYITKLKQGEQQYSKMLIRTK